MYSNAADVGREEYSCCNSICPVSVCRCIPRCPVGSLFLWCRRSVTWVGSSGWSCLALLSIRNELVIAVQLWTSVPVSENTSSHSGMNELTAWQGQEELLNWPGDLISFWSEFLHPEWKRAGRILWRNVLAGLLSSWVLQTAVSVQHRLQAPRN